LVAERARLAAGERLWFKARIGFDLKQIVRLNGFCAQSTLMWPHGTLGLIRSNWQQWPNGASASSGKANWLVKTTKWPTAPSPHV